MTRRLEQGPRHARPRSLTPADFTGPLLLLAISASSTIAYLIGR